ncbi:unnamed protein product [Camellia sinensis]
MHLWPSMRIRESFKQSYLEKLEWNLHRMNIKKKKQQQQQQKQKHQSESRQRLLDDEDDVTTETNQGDGIVVDSENNHTGGALYRELLFILSCCYGYFCCGECDLVSSTQREMDEVFGEIMGCGFGSDSIMLRLLRCSMDKAHENVQSTDGAIELLNARSKFYELAMVLVEGCSKLIEEKAEVPESNREKMLLDLTESGDMVRGRLMELKLGMIEKDRELMERLENECRLRQALELKEMELVSLRAKLELERTKTEETEDFLSGDEGKEGDFCYLKNSVDRQVSNIKQKLEDERISLSSASDFYGYDGFEAIQLNHFSRPEQNIIIEQMSSDIDGLQGTLDLAFGRMQSVEMRPLEKQWRWGIEDDIMVILIKGFMNNLHYNFETELKNRAKQAHASFLMTEHWEELVDEITNLHDELEALCFSNEGQRKRVKDSNNCSETSIGIRRTSSEPLPEFYYVEEPHEEEQDRDQSHYVAKMIKNHETIIRKQREELNWLKREILQEKVSLSIRRLKDPNNLATRIQEVITRLGNVIKWDAKFGDYKGVYEQENLLDEEKIMGFHSLAYFGEKERRTYLNEEIRKLKQEKDDSNLQTILMEETYVIIFRGLIKDFYLELDNYEIDSEIRSDICMHFFGEMVSEWNLNFETKDFGIRVGEKVYYTVCSSTAKEFFCDQNAQVESHVEEPTSSRSLSNYLKSKVSEDVFGEFFQEMAEEFKGETNCHATGDHIKEERYHVIVDEMVKNFERTSAYWCIERILKEDIYMVFFRETIKEWKMERDDYNSENLIREEIYNFVIVEAVKDAYIFLRESEVPNHESAKSSEGGGEENLVRKIDFLLKCFEVEEDLMLKASCEIKEHNANNGLVASECEEVDERYAIEWLLTEEESTFSSVSDKLDTALQQMLVSKVILRELQDSLGLAIGNIGKDHDKEYPFFQLNDNQILQLNLSDSMFSPLIRFQQMLLDFECLVRQKLDMNFLRVDLLGDQVAVLLGLLEKIYLVLDQYSPVLSLYFPVSDILKLIEKELSGVDSHTTR